MGRYLRLEERGEEALSWLNWPHSLMDPSQTRNRKPRENGITMVIDKGLGVDGLKDLLEVSGAYVDYLKLGFGTSVLYPSHYLKHKIQLAKEYGVKIYPGGTLTEVAIYQQEIPHYLRLITQIGFNAIEISEGTLSYPPEVRKEIIVRALDAGLDVITEFGKKEQGSIILLSELEERLLSDIFLGVSYVIVEGRESGTGVGIYDQNGNFDGATLYDFVHHWAYKDRLIWEAPLKKQQVHFIQLFGTNVNLGNIAPGEVIALEALRRGLRSDTFIFKEVLGEV
ncbi:MAG: phosphosulfolactate synthase [Thermicanus sp.]|nr:phosphosulfolactate synthase [Thermicanus sp.]